jgi:hypothetical protein
MKSQLLKYLSLAIIGTVVTTGVVWSVNSGLKPGQSSKPGLIRGIAPEIDAASGTSAIALLTVVSLLAGERRRNRHS